MTVNDVLIKSDVHVVSGIMSTLHPPPPPSRVGSTYCFITVSFLVASHQLLRDPLLKFFWVACFLLPRSLSVDFCYDLDIWGQGQALRAFFVMSFFTILSKV